MYSPQKSAKIAGVSRKTVMDAINAKKLNATRNNRNHWVISEDDLKAWMDSRGAKHIPDTSSDTSSDFPSDSPVIPQRCDPPVIPRWPGGPSVATQGVPGNKVTSDPPVIPQWPGGPSVATQGVPGLKVTSVPPVARW